MNPESSIEKGWLLISQGKHRLAEDELRKALAVVPNHSIGHAYLALALSGLKREKEALKEVDEAIHHGPELAYPHYVKSTLLGRKARLKEALVCIQEAIRLEPESPTFFEYLSQVHFAQKEWKKALEAAEKGLELDAENTACLSARTQALIKLGRRGEAAKSLASSLSGSPDNALVHSQRGYLLLEEGKYDEALKAFEESMRLDPTDQETREGLARALKSRYPLYGWILKYFLWTEKFSGSTRSYLSIGIYVVFRGLVNVGRNDPHLQAVVIPITAVLAVLVLGTWLSDHLFNMVLCLTPAGRVVLSDDKVLRYQWFGGCVLLSLLLAAAAWWKGDIFFVLAAIGCLALIIPIAVTFECPPGRARKWMAIFNIFMVLCGISAFVLTKLFHPGDASLLDITVFVLEILSISGILLSLFIKGAFIRWFDEK